VVQAQGELGSGAQRRMPRPRCAIGNEGLIWGILWKGVRFDPQLTILQTHAPEHPQQLHVHTHYTSTYLQTRWMQGDCRFGDRCNFAHGEEGQTFVRGFSWVLVESAFGPGILLLQLAPISCPM